MFKKFSSLLIIFAVAISLIVLSETESNAQCGGCGEPECDAEYANGGEGHGSYIPWFDIVRLTTPIPPGTSLFFLTNIEAVSGCIVCQDPETDNESLVPLPSREISTQIYSSSEDLQPAECGLERLTQEACETAVEEVCGECDGKVSELTLRYDGDEGAQITVYQHKIDNATFDEYVEPDGEFTLSGLDKWQGTLGPKISVNRDNNTITEIHTSCSEPVGPGFVSGDFTVMSGYSRYGGLLCPIDGSLNGSECIVEEFEQEWGLSSADCQDGWMPSQILLQENYLTGTILYCTLDENGNPYLDENGNPDDCSQGDEICLYCQTEEACETWNDDGEVIFDCVPCDDVDSDSDGFLGDDDNCPINCNSGQLDADEDGIGDVCDSTPGCGPGSHTTIICEQECGNSTTIPELVSPAPGAEMDNGRLDRTDSIDWSFSWSPVAGAEKYNLFVEHTGAELTLIDNSDITDTTYDSSDCGDYILDENRFNWFWKVRAYKDGQWGDWSEVRYFDAEPLDTDPPNSNCEEPTWIGSEVTGTVWNLWTEDPDGDNSTYAWPDPNPTNVSLESIEFTTEIAKYVRATADFTSNTLSLKYEHFIPGGNIITYPPLIYTFEFENDINFTAVNLFSGGDDIILHYTSNSITLEVPTRVVGPGDIFTTTYELIF